MAKVFPRAAECFQLASDAHFKTGSLYMSAKAMENAASISVQIQNVNQAVSQYEKASRIYVAQGSPDRGAECLTKAAKLFFLHTQIFLFVV